MDIEGQRIRLEARRGFQKRVLRFRLARQMESSDVENADLALVNSHDAGNRSHPPGPSSLVGSRNHTTGGCYFRRSHLSGSTV